MTGVVGGMFGYIRQSFCLTTLIILGSLASQVTLGGGFGFIGAGEG